MTCFKPLIRVCSHYPETIGEKSKTLKIIGNLKEGDLEHWDSMNEYWTKIKNSTEGMPDDERPTEAFLEAQRIPCGKCIGCRIEYSKNGRHVVYSKPANGNITGS